MDEARVLTHERFQRPPVRAARWLSKGELARILGYTTRTVDRWVADGLPEDSPSSPGAWRYVGSRRRFLEAETLAWLDSRR